MDDKVQKLLQRAINENLSPDRVSYIMQFNGYDQSAIDAALDELSKKKRPVLFQKQYDSSDTPSPSQQVGPPRPSEEEAPVPAPADVNLGEPLTFDQGTGGLTSVADEKEVEVSVSDWWGDKWNGLVEGVSDFMYHFDKETGNTKEQIAEFVELSKEKYPELYNTYQQNLQSEDLLNLGYDQERIKREAAQQAYVDFWQTNPDIENEVVPFIRERRRQQDVEETGVKIDEAVTKELDSRFLSGAVKGLAGSIPAMVTAGATMGGSFMTTSYYAADEDLKRTFAENPDLEMTRGQQEAYKLTVAGVEGILEKIGLSGALKGTSMAKSVLAKKVFSRLAGMGEDVSSEAFERIVKQEAKGLKGYLKNTAQGTLSEAETGALQQLSVDLINETVNGLSGQEIFTPKSAMTIIQDAIYAGAQEAVGGGIISGSVGAFSRDIATQEDFDAAEEFIGRIEISKLEENLDKRVAQDKITEAEKENILNTAKEFKQTMAKVPEDVDQESKRKIYQLINEKMNIQKKAAGKDEAIQNKANERVEGINEQIANIYEAQTKKQAAPVSPAEGATEAAPTTEVSPESEVETRFFAPAIEKDSKGSAIVDPGKVREETFTGASVISKGHVDEDTALNINSALSLLGEKAKDMKVRVFDSVESLLNADQRAADFYVKNNKMPKAYIKGNEMFVLTKNAVEQYNKAKGTNVEYAKQYIHEVGHPIVSTLVAEDPEAQDRLYSEIEAAAAEGDVVAQRALAFGKNYASQGEGKVKNESLVEFMALVTDQKRFKSLNRTTKQKIKDFFNSLLSSISSEVVIKTDAELYDVARSMRDAFRMQKAINIQPTTNKQYQQRSTEFSVDEGTKPGNRLFNEPLPDALAIAEKYMQEKGIDYDPGKAFNTLNTEMSQEIAAAYDSMEHNPKDPEVKKAYEVMVKETAEQYDAIIAEGYVVEINNNEPYSSSKDMIEDLASNKRMKIFSTESGFGSEEITDDQRADNPLLRDSGYTDVNGEKLLMNDVFRFVHDFFGHAKRGNGFGPKGEENAWDVHSRMYTPVARRAMTSETRGQNSWVNFSGVNEEAFKLRDKARKLRKEGRTDEASKLIEQVYEMMSFAEQKIGLMPEKYTANPYIEGGDPDFSLDDVEGTEEIVSGKTANTVINKAKRTEFQSLSVNDIDYDNLSTTAQPIGLAKKILSGTFKYKKQGKDVKLPIGLKDTRTLKNIEQLVDDVRNAKGKDKAVAKTKLGVAVESSIMEIKDFMKANIRSLYNTLTPKFVEKSKQWYDGANRIAQQFSKDYEITVEQASGILAALSPQNDWFNNITNANHVLEVMTNYRETKLTDDLISAAVEYSNSKSTKPGDSEFSIRLKNLYKNIGSMSISDLEAQETANNVDRSGEKANVLRAISLANLSQQNKTIDPEGNVVGTYAMPHTWMTDTVIVNAINIFNDGSPEIISSSLGDGNKVRNFYNNIVDPNSPDNFLTADTHALAVALASPISAADAGGFGLFGGNQSITYAIVKDAYIEVAKEVGILPRQLQSVTWEAVRTGVNNPARPKKKETLKLIEEQAKSNLTYEERANEIIKLNPSFTPEWAKKRGIEAQKDLDGLRQEDGRATDAKDDGVSPSRGGRVRRVRGSDSGMGEGATGGIDFSTDEGINWYESPEGKGDPAISRRDDMLQEAAQDLKAGRLKNYEFREMAKALSPIEPITRFFAPATTERMAEALDKNKLSSLNKDVKDGEIVALRLDIPAYTKKNTWVVSIHDGKKNDGKIISYRSVGRITDVVFKSKPLSALSIAGGEAKSTIGRMFGKYKSFDGKTPEDQAETAKNLVSKVWKDSSYKQIGMNPTRASYFYDRGSGRPVVSAEEVIQIGGLVYAKNPVYARWNDPAFEVKGYNDVDGAPIYFSADEGEGNVNNLRRTVSRTIGRFTDSRERILSNPDAYYTKQSLKSIKENLELMTEDELLENMTAEGLNRVANEAGPGKGENDISVLAAVELINRKAEAGEDVSELLVDLAKVGTTVGRMLRHFAELKSATPLGIVATIEGALAKANRIMSATQVEKLTDIAERFIKAGQVVKDLRDELESGYSKETEAKLTNASKDLDKVTRELNKFTSLIVPKKTMNLLSTTIQGNLLTPISQITNVGANLFQIATSIPVRGFETLFSKITGKFSGGTKRSFKYSLMAIPFALKRGGIGVAEAIETIIKGGASTDKIIHTGFLPGAAFLAALSDTKFASMVNKTLGKEAIKGDVLPQMANGKINPADRLKALYEGVFGIAPEIMFRFLALGDKPFSRFAEGMETYQQAARLGLKGDALKNYIKYPNKKQQKAIEEAGRKLTFQQDSKIATGFFGATNWLEKQGPIGSAVAFALKLTMPYVKTPANIFTETLKFAVPGIGMASAIRNFQKKNFDEGASDLAKAATGQMLVIAANALIANGLVSGAFGEEDEEERSLKYLKFPPMSINKSGLARLMKGENPDYRDGDVFMRYDKFGIVGMVIGARVTSIKNNLVEAKGEAEGYYVGKKDKGFFEPFNRVFDELGVGLGTVQFLNSQSFLTGANGLLSVLSGEASEYDVEKWFENTFRSVTAIPLPNTLSSIHRSIREYMPNLRTNSVENKFRYILMDRLFNTDGVPIKIDMLGNKIPQTPEGANKWIYNLMDFTKTQESRDQFILNEIYRLYELQEQADLIPGFPTKIQKIPTRHPETGAKITGWDAQKEEEYRRGLQEIQEVYGKKRADILERLFRSDSYQTLTNERKQERVIETLQDYDRGYTMIKALPGSGMKNLKPPMEWAKMLNELNDKYFD